MLGLAKRVNSYRRAHRRRAAFETSGLLTMAMIVFIASLNPTMLFAGVAVAALLVILGGLFIFLLPVMVFLW
jgi:hypothetical protein